MDQSLSSLYPIHQIGSDGFSWWVGQVESDKKDDPKRSGRFRVRIIGQHLKTGENATGTEELPWAHLMMPVTTPFIEGGTGGASPGLKRGCFVIGFYLDNDKQKPIIMGSVGGVKGATEIINQDTGSGPLNFKAVLDPDTNPKQDRSTDTQSGKNENNANTDKGVIDADKSDLKNGAPPVLLAAYAKHSESNPTGGKSCVTIANPNCGSENNLKNGITRILGDLLAANQASGGNIGDYYVSKVNGLLYDGVAIGRYHVGRVIRLAKSFIARGKTEVTKALRGAIDFLNKSILTTEETVGYVAKGPYANPEEAFVPITERSNKLKKVKEIFDDIFKELGCSIADFTDTIAKFITDLILGYLTDVFSAAACFIDVVVDGILNEILAGFDELVAQILAPIQAILEAAGAPLNIIGGILNKFMKLLGISCTGPSQKCEPIQQKCVDCGTNDGEDDLDRLLQQIEDGIGDQGLFVCDEAKQVPKKDPTAVSFIGGIYDDPTNSPPNETPPSDAIVDFPLTPLDPDNEIQFPDDGIDDGGGGSPVPEFPDDSGGGTPTPEDDTPFISVSADKSVYNEGETILYTITGLNVPDGTIINYALSGPTITSEDLSKLNDSVTMIGNTASVSILTLDDGVVDLAPELVLFEATGTASVTQDAVTTETELNAIEEVLIDSENTETPEDFDDTTDAVPAYSITTDKSQYKEGEDVIATVTTQNVSDGTIIDYYLIGINVTPSDFVSNSLTGQFTIVNNKSQIAIGIEDDTENELTENVTIILSGKGVSTEFSILVDENDIPPIGGDESGETFIPTKPIVGTPITDEDGSIIDIPIKTPGGPYQKAPQVIVTGNGYGAGALALLDSRGFVTEVRVTRQGVNYLPNTADENNLRCIVDSFTMLSPGVGYTSIPQVLVDGKENVAAAEIDERGFVVSIRTLDRSLRYKKMPKVTIIGGGGGGARFLANVTCLDNNDLERKGYAKIGTGSYVDCP